MSIAVWVLEVSLVPGDHFASALLEQGGAHSGSVRLQGLMLQMLENQEQLVPAF